MPKLTITPFLWFDDNLEEAIEFYRSVFPDMKVHGMSRGPGGMLFGAEFEIAGQRLNAMNGGPAYTFNEAISMFVVCDGQAEVDRLWESLTANGGEPGDCGWLKDRFGLSWQIVPLQFLNLMSGGDAEKGQRVMAAMQMMSKTDIEALQAAADAAPESA